MLKDHIITKNLNLKIKEIEEGRIIKLDCKDDTEYYCPECGSYWQEEIGRMFRFTKTNGITEGFHRKMKLIQRRAYGFRNFENYHLRVRILCA